METVYAYHCLLEFHWLPSEFLNLPIREKAVIIAFLEEYAENRKKAEREAKRKKGMR